MATAHVATKDPKTAAAVLEKSLKGPLKGLTIADAATQSGLALREAQTGLHYLVSDYRGHLSATQKGELLFDFPYGFTKPWQAQDRFEEALKKVKKFALGVAKLVVRAWISVVLIAYVAIFAVILIGLTLAKSSDREDNRGSSFGGTLLLHTLLRVVLDSLFWTFHPFSPFYVGNRYEAFDPYYTQKPKVPFYEKVNRFFFGPEEKPEDPLENSKRILEAIRVGKGRIDMLDVMRVTGLSKEKADPLMSKLLLDYDGEVKVSQEGGITYVFTEVMKSHTHVSVKEPVPAWKRLKKLLPFTGNELGSNLMIASLNGFNLVMSFVAIQADWTIQKLTYLFTAGAYQAKYGMLPPMPVDGVPLVLGWIPFCFSAALFAIPMVRAMGRKREKRRLEQENGRLSMMRVVVSELTPRGIPEATLVRAFKEGAGREPTMKELIRTVVSLGGTIETSSTGIALYRFKELEADARALAKERAQATDSERNIGQVVFSSAR